MITTEVNECALGTVDETTDGTIKTKGAHSTNGSDSFNVSAVWWRS
ncbi:MAG: hypothetical protein ACTS4V_01535 [Candidatus Hodgkinia cicadicola]